MGSFVHNVFFRRPYLAILVYALVGCTLVLVQMHRVAEETRTETATEAAVSYAAAIAAVRDYYSNEVVARAKAGGIAVTHAYRDQPGSIPLPATFSIELSEHIGKTAAGSSFRLFSSDPFPWRESGGPRDDFERRAIATLSDGTRDRLVAVESSEAGETLRYATPVRLSASCVACHNEHPLSPRQDWEEGDIRGVQSVRIALPPLSLLASPMAVGDFAFMICGIAAGLILFAMMLRRLNNLLIEERRSNAALIEAKTAAELADRSKSEFLANMSHELRTPLNAILGFSEIIRDGAFGPVGDARYIEYAGDINSSGAHLLALINDILDLSKIEAGRRDVDPEPVDMVEVIDLCVRMVDERAGDAGLVIVRDLPKSLPNIQADSRAMTQVVLNLLSNAVKFTPTGGRIEIRARMADDGTLTLAIADTGQGMAASDIPKALTPFTQLENPLNKGIPGTGLGLPLAKGLVELHGGHLRIDSRPGIGTTVTIELPGGPPVGTVSAENEATSAAA